MHTESSSPRVTPVDDGCLLREHACCWNKNGGEKRSKIEEREIREKREKRDDKRKRAHVWVSMKLKKTRVLKKNREKYSSLFRDSELKRRGIKAREK